MYTAAREQRQAEGARLRRDFAFGPDTVLASRQMISMRKIPILLLLLFSVTAFAQTVIPNGSITLKSGEKYNFVNLHIDGDKVLFNDVATNKDLTYPLAEVKS